MYRSFTANLNECVRQVDRILAIALTPASRDAKPDAGKSAIIAAAQIIQQELATISNIEAGNSMDRAEMSREYADLARDYAASKREQAAAHCSVAEQAAQKAIVIAKLQKQHFTRAEVDDLFEELRRAAAQRVQEATRVRNKAQRELDAAKESRWILQEYLPPRRGAVADANAPTQGGEDA